MAATAQVAVQQTLREAGTILDPRYWNGKVHYSIDTIEAAGEDVGSTYEFLGFPKGCIVLGGCAYWDALGTSSKLVFGDGSDADEFLAATATSAAGMAWFNLLGTIGEVLTADKNVVATSDTAATTGTIKVLCLYGTLA